MPSKVYFKEAREPGARKPALAAILTYAPSFKKDSFVAIKITIGDVTSRHYVKPELVREVVEKVKADGAKPFVFDTNVLYIGARMNAVGHMNLAYKKGFTPDAIGAPFIVADGIFGADGKEFRVNYEHIKKIKTPSFVGVVDNLIVLSHITGHMMTSYAGAIKNVGMGMSSRSGKQVQHSSVKPNVIKDKCVMCGSCIPVCPVKAIARCDDTALINARICIGCGECLCACVYEAISINWKTDYTLFYKRMTEYAAGILAKFNNVFFINCAFDVTKECDCMAAENEPIISQDVGIVASGDIVAVEKATADLLTQKEDIFLKAQNHSYYADQINYAHALSLGDLDYTLVRV